MRKTLTINEVAGKLDLSYSRTRQLFKEMAIRPVEHRGNQPLYTLVQVHSMKQRNTKPGPRSNGNKEKKR